MKRMIGIVGIFLFILNLTGVMSLQKIEQNLEDVTGSDKIELLNYLCTQYWYKDTNKSVIYALQAYDLSKDIGDFDAEIESLENIALCYGLQQEYQKAKNTYKQILDKKDLIKDKKHITNALTNLAYLSSLQDNYDDALHYYFLLQKIYKNSNDTGNLAKILSKIAKIYKLKGNLETSLSYYVQSLQIDEKNISEIVKNDYLHLSEKYVNLNDTEKAVEYYKLFTAINDSLHNQKIKDQIEKFKNRYDLSKKKLESENAEIVTKLNIENKKKNKLKKKVNKLISETQKKEKILEKISKEKKLKELQIHNQKLQINNYKLELSNKELLIKQQKAQRVYYYFIILISIVFTFTHIFLYHLKKRDNFLLSRANEDIKRKNEELTKLNITLNEIARTDPLTNLSNRRDILEKIEYEKNRMERTGKSFILIISDIDDFKKINDTYGHDFGDVVLKKIAEILKITLRKQDIVSRWGGEEFLLMLPETNLNGAYIAANKIRANIEKYPFEFKGEAVQVTMTFGAKTFDLALKTEEVIGLADESLYEGKKSGKNRVILYDKMNA